MTAANRRRGADTERMAAAWFRTYGFPGADRTVRTGYRTSQRASADCGDLNLAPGLIAQVKSLRPANAAERMVHAWMAETEQQRQAARADVALLIVRRDGTGDVGEWWAWLPLVVLECLRNGDDRHCTPEAWTAADSISVRLLAAEAAYLLRAAGYGDPLTEMEATG